MLNSPPSPASKLPQRKDNKELFVEAFLQRVAPLFNDEAHRRSFVETNQGKLREIALQLFRAHPFEIRAPQEKPERVASIRTPSGELVMYLSHVCMKNPATSRPLYHGVMIEFASSKVKELARGTASMRVSFQISPAELTQLLGLPPGTDGAATESVSH